MANSEPCSATLQSGVPTRCSLSTTAGLTKQLEPTRSCHNHCASPSSSTIPRRDQRESARAARGDGHDALLAQGLDNDCGVAHMTTPATATTKAPSAQNQSAKTGESTTLSRVPSSRESICPAVLIVAQQSWSPELSASLDVSVAQALELCAVHPEERGM